MTLFGLFGGLKKVLNLALLLSCLFVSTEVMAVTLPDIATPDWLSATSVGEQINHNGVDMKVQYFSTQSRSAKAILDYYRNDWAAQSDYPPVENTVGSWQVLGYQQGNLYYSVQVQQQDHQTVTGLLSVTSLPSTAPKRSSDFPMLPGSTLLSVTEGQDGDKRGNTVVIENTASLSSNIDFYTSILKDQGWRIAQSLKGDDLINSRTHVLLLTKTQRVGQVSISRTQLGKTHIVANISQDYR